MLRWAAVCGAVTLVAALLALFEPALAMSGKHRLLFFVLLLPLLRLPRWLLFAGRKWAENEGM